MKILWPETCWNLTHRSSGLVFPKSVFIVTFWTVMSVNNDN